MIKRSVHEIINKKLIQKEPEADVLNAIRFILKYKTIVYFPDMRNNTKLIQTFYSYLKGSDYKLYIIVDDNMKKDKTKLYPYAKVITCLEIHSISAGDVVIFDDIKGAKIYQEYNDTGKNIILGITNSSLLFYKIFTMKTEFKCYTPIEDGNKDRNLYKKIICSSTIVNYNDTISFFKLQPDHEVVRYYNRLYGKNKHLFTKYIEGNLLSSYVLKHHLSCDINFESDKISTLRSILILVKHKRCCIVVKNYETKVIIEKFMLEKNNSLCQTRSLIESRENKSINKTNYSKTDISNQKINIGITKNKDKHTKPLKEILKNKHYESSVFICTYSELSAVKKDIQVVIFFDFYPFDTVCTKYILCGKNEKNWMERLIAIEEAIDSEIRPKILMQCFANSAKISQNTKNHELVTDKTIVNKENTHKYTIYTGNNNIDNIRQKLEPIALDMRIIKEEFTVWLKTSNSLVTSLQLISIFKCPIGYVPFYKSTYNYVICNTFRIGHINLYNSFVPIEIFTGMGYIFLQKTLSIFLFSKKINIRIEIEPKHLESKIFLDINEANLLIFLACKIPQKIYILKYIDPNKYENLKFCEMSKKYVFMDELNWERITSNEMSFLEYYFDICLTINLLEFERKNDMIGISQNSTYVWLNGIMPETQRQNIIKNLECANCYLYHIESITNKLASYGTVVCISEVEDNKLSGKTVVQIRDEFSHLKFDSLYCLESILSEKGKFICHKINDLTTLKKCNLKSLASYFDLYCKNRFASCEGIVKACKLNSFLSSNPSDQDKRVKQITITPTRLICGYSEQNISNRVLRNFDSSNFIRVYFKDEDGSLIKNDDIRENENVYQRIKACMKFGISIGDRKYFFLAMSSSQLKLHSAWFIRPYVYKNHMIGADYIRSWIGSFHKIHNIGKYAVRLGQALSTTTPTLQIQKIRVESDITKNGYTFSDGVGLISQDLAEKVTAFLKVNSIPSAFQIRIGGFKGVVSVFKNYKEWDKSKYDVADNLTASTDLSKRRKILEGHEEFFYRQIETETLILRQSMKKFDSEHRVLEVVTFSQYTGCKLNRQIINLLEALGISKNTFLELQDNSISNVIVNNNMNILEFQSHLKNSNFDCEKTVLKIRDTSANKHFTDFVKKSKIFICKGRILMGILDEYKVLEENQVFIRVSPCKNDMCDGILSEGHDKKTDKFSLNYKGLQSKPSKYENNQTETQNYKRTCNIKMIETITGEVVISKNPCLHPGDIRIVTAIDNSVFHHLVDVVVFSQKGFRPITDMCSGSDLDGDCYFCIWDKRLIPKTVYEPATYRSENALYKEVVSIEDIINFYTRFMRDNHLGYIANAHLALSDKLENGVLEPECLRLANLFNLGVDFPKTGYVARLPNDLTPETFPDFMTNLPNYKSQKTLGLLYRRSLVLSQVKFPDCECTEKVNEHLQYIHNFTCNNIYNIRNMKNKINLLHRNIIENKYDYDIRIIEYLKNSFAIIEPFMPEVRFLFGTYIEEHKNIINKKGIINENQLLLGVYEEEVNTYNALMCLKNLNNKYNNLLYKNVEGELLFSKAMAWYYAGNEHCNTSCTNFCWLCFDIFKVNIEQFKTFRNACDSVIFHSNFEKNDNIEIIKALNQCNTTIWQFTLSKKIYFMNRNDPAKFNHKQEKNYYNHKGHIYVYSVLYFTTKIQIQDSSLMKDTFAVFYALKLVAFNQTDSEIEFLAFLSMFAMISDIKNMFVRLLIEMSKHYILQEDYESTLIHFIMQNFQHYENGVCEDLISISSNVNMVYRYLHFGDSEAKGNKLFLAAYILSTNHRLGIKLIACDKMQYVFNQSMLSTSPKKKNSIIKNNKLFNFIINGMFDNSDMIYLRKIETNLLEKHKNYHKYAPMLLNPGKCTFKNYKNDLRAFLVSNIWSRQKREVFIRVNIIPGQLYFYNMPEKYINNNFELRALVNDINENINVNNNPNFNKSFFFLNDMLFFGNFEHSVKFVEADVNEHIMFTVILNNTSYFVNFSCRQKKIIMIVKNKSSNFKFVFVGKKDVQFDVFCEDIIYSNLYNIDLLSKDEEMLLSLELVKENNGILKLTTVMHSLTNIKLHIVTTSLYTNKTDSDLANANNDVSVVKRLMYNYDSKKNRFVYLKVTKICACIINQRLHELDFKSFDEYYENLWLSFEVNFADKLYSGID